MNSFNCMVNVTNKVDLGFGFCEDSGRVETLRTCCGRLDRFAERFGGVSCEATVDVDADEIRLSLICGDFQIEDKLDEFYLLVMGTKRVDIRQYNEDLLQIDFVFGGIWVKTEEVLA